MRAVDEASAPADLVVVQVRPGRQELEGVRGVAVGERHDAVERPGGGAVDGEMASGEYRGDLHMADRPVDNAIVIRGDADVPRQAAQGDRVAEG